MNKLFHNILDVIFLIYAISIVVHYFVLAIVALFELRRSTLESKLSHYKSLMISSYVPKVSIIAPAYNEENSIIENIKGLLHLQYPHYEVIVVNDGSKDNTLNTVIEAFDLKKVAFAIDNKIAHKPIRGIYKSTKEAFQKIILIDKENGGKSDALNAGINIAEGKYFMTIDVDTIISPYVIQHLIKPFFDYTDRKVIAVGGAIGVANSCEFRHGHLLKINIPNSILARFQVLEYTRAFLLSRLGWNRLNGLILVSGALGMFDREIVSECGGYNTQTVGEDMDLVIRMRRHMYEMKEKHKVVLIPDPLSWTEVPEKRRIFGKQRSRWARGLIYSLINHRKVFFNPRYGIMGLIIFPVTALYEWWAPVIQILGVGYFIYLASIHHVYWPYFLILLFFVYLFGIAFSTWALLYDHFAYHKYRNTWQIIQLLLIAWIEAFSYNLLNSFYSLIGNYEYFIKGKKKSWGEMGHQGFATLKKPS